jgi:hypothetical protein
VHFFCWSARGPGCGISHLSRQVTSRPCKRHAPDEVFGKDRSRKNRTVRSTALRAVADVDAPPEQNIFYLTKRQRIADVHHHHGADHLGRTVEITERIVYRRKLRNAPARLKPIYSDNDRTPKIGGSRWTGFCGEAPYSTFNFSFSHAANCLAAGLACSRCGIKR